MVKIKFYDYSEGYQLTNQVKPDHFKHDLVKLKVLPSVNRLSSPNNNISDIEIKAFEINKEGLNNLLLMFQVNFSNPLQISQEGGFEIIQIEFMSKELRELLDPSSYILTQNCPV